MMRRFICEITKKKDLCRYRPIVVTLILTLCLAALTACGGSSSSGSSGSGGTVPESLTSYVMPDEISAVPTAGTQDVSRAYHVSVFRALARYAAADLPADSDYHTAGTRKFVEEHTLEQFDILEDVLTALNQTHYYDQIGQPAYRAMVIQVGGDGKQAQKTLEPWVVESDIIDSNGNVVEVANASAGGDYDLRVRCWIEEEEEGETQLIRAEFVITDPPNQNSDGSFSDYGQWTLNVKFGEGDDDFFAATCTTDEDGGNVITLNEKFDEGGPAGEFAMEVSAIMHRGDSQGYGKVSYPDWEAVHGPEADENLTTIPHIEAVYAYNDDLFAVQEEDASEPTYKSRTEEPVEMTHRYGVYDGVTGEDVLKTKSFGFPFFYTAEGSTRRGYYGAWQGRHQIWADGADLPAEGTVLTREDWGDQDSDPETYKMGPTFDGTFVQRTYIDAQLADIQDIPVEIWINQDYQLSYNSGDGKWYHCPEMNWGTYPPSCNVSAEDFEAVYGMEILTKNENDSRKHININGWDQSANENKHYVYLAANTKGTHAAGFYLAEENQQTHQTTVKDPLVAIDPTEVPQLWVWVGGSIYVEYNGTGWVEKEVVHFNEQYYKPEFGPNDKDYTLPEGRELYVNLQGANYVVRKENGVTSIKMELQTAANPANVASGGSLVALSGYTFREPWADNNSTYTFDTDPASDTYLMLIYATVGDNDKDQNGDPNVGVTVNGVVAKDIWGIVAYESGSEVLGTDDEPLAFNWEHDSDGAQMSDWGSVTYLLNADDTYALLDDPIRFVSITAQNNGGDTKTLALQFDGWMMGLPDMYQELSKNDWTMTPELADKIVNLAAGTELTDASDITQTYLLKPLEISQFLPVVDDTTGLTLPDVAQADDIDLTAIDIYTAPTMGGLPSGTTLLYSEGKLLTD
jgi:hypothetical protein